MHGSTNIKNKCRSLYLLGIVFYGLYFMEFYEVCLSVDVLNVGICMV